MVKAITKKIVASEVTGFLSFPEEMWADLKKYE